MLLKACQFNLTLFVRNVIMRRWAHIWMERYRILVKYMKINIWWSRHLLFFVFEVFSTHFCYNNGGRDCNPLFLTGPLQPWQTFTLLSQRLTKVIRTSLKVMSRIAFMKFLRGLSFTKKPFQFYWFFCEEYFSKIIEICV